MLTSSSGYTPDGQKRLVAGVIALNPEKTKVILVRNKARDDKGWIFPKGGWEDDEDVITKAVSREAWEESGIKFVNPAVNVGKVELKTTLAQYFQVEAAEVADVWPEDHRWDRKWATYKEAKGNLAARKDQLAMLERSGIKKN